MNNYDKYQNLFFKIFIGIVLLSIVLTFFGLYIFDNNDQLLANFFAILFFFYLFSFAYSIIMIIIYIIKNIKGKIEERPFNLTKTIITGVLSPIMLFIVWVALIIFGLRSIY
ncbi:hypothetical protein CI105_04960 [Candidatus Izimaplasma bacterium ZiA1]|uniref:hypothetical protein n=1 Tax=Candidatus Izimoplasma sp. ZiA1 TaxID=2024899 RepID=UPI000BAA3C7E|nr:hypothetical protein CI105_04960 [Candidatus Izimaplasma bacterium ZiA1]